MKKRRYYIVPFVSGLFKFLFFNLKNVSKLKELNKFVKKGI